MTFEFVIHKTLAAVGHLCARNKGPAGVLRLIKMLYVADREALIPTAVRSALIRKRS